MLEGNHTLSMRGLEGTSSSPLISIDIMLGENTGTPDSPSSSSDVILYGSVVAAIMLTIIILVVVIKGDNHEEIMIVEDSDIADIVEAEIL
jgi:hypothetical protein